MSISGIVLGFFIYFLIQFKLYQQQSYQLQPMEKQTTAAKQQGDDMATKISQKDQAKMLKKKIQMLKYAVLQQRNKHEQMQGQLRGVQQKVKKYESENKKKEQKNEALLIQIRTLKDALIVERNEKQKYMEQMRIREEEDKGKELNWGGKMSASNYFGLKGLFNK